MDATTREMINKETEELNNAINQLYTYRTNIYRILYPRREEFTSFSRTHGILSGILFVRLYNKSFCCGFLFVCLFIFLRERERERECEQGRGRERDTHRICRRLQDPSCQHRARHDAQSHHSSDHDLSQSDMPNQLNHQVPQATQ